jgi:hypothetical protein
VTIRVEYRQFDQDFDPPVADYRPQLLMAGPGARLACLAEVPVLIAGRAR